MKVKDILDCPHELRRQMFLQSNLLMTQWLFVFSTPNSNIILSHLQLAVWNLREGSQGVHSTTVTPSGVDGLKFLPQLWSNLYKKILKLGLYMF